MKASLRSARISPKKANLIAQIVRGKSVEEAQTILERTHKKAARVLSGLLQSAVANAQTNDNQDPQHLMIKSLTVNKAQAYHRGVPMARGRMRPMRKFLSHIALTLGIAEGDGTETKNAPVEKAAKTASQNAPKKVQTGSPSGSTPPRGASPDKEKSVKGSSVSKGKTATASKVSADSQSSSPSTSSSSTQK